MTELSEVVDAKHPVFDAIVDALASPGWGVFTGVVDDELLWQLHKLAVSLEGFRQAAVGRDLSRQVNRQIRGDEIVWIEADGPAQKLWLQWCDALRRCLNRGLMTNLISFESHFAHYAPGTFYQQHYDAFRGSASRVISIVLYLNPQWSVGQGGELVIYGSHGHELARVVPAMGTFVAFESERFLHEVLPVSDDRYSIAGWFRSRPQLPVDAGAG
jgi:SM-20-related protein